MFSTVMSCTPLSTNKEKYWNYQQHFVGDKDSEGRKDGKGENHWFGAKSLEWYEGDLVRDTLHGVGDYHWRFLGPENSFITYEGHFYCNRIQGYGTMSYANGRTFSGLFLNHSHWGPGIESHSNLCDDVGLWRGSRLLRLVWQPSAPNIIPDFMATNNGRAVVESHRVILTPKKEKIGEINTALELLKHHGADPCVAVNNWHKVHSKYCTDVASPLCDVDHWNQTYYDGSIETLQEFEEVLNDSNPMNGNEEKATYYYSWNNNRIMTDMMKHAYKHEKQRNSSLLDLKHILSGPRSHFKRPGNHELECRTMLMACYLGYAVDVARLVNDKNINPNICDGLGNSAIMYAACGDQTEITHLLVEAGGDVDLCNDNCYTPLALALMRFTCVQNDVAPNAMLQALLPPMLISTQGNVYEWNMLREHANTGSTPVKTPSKTRNMSSKKIKSLLSIKEQPLSKRKTDPETLKILEPDMESISEEMKSYNENCREYWNKVNDIFLYSSGPTVVPYLFNVSDVIKEIETNEEDQKKQSEKLPKKAISKLLKETVKPSKDALWDTKEKEMQLIDDSLKRKQDVLSKIMLTILQLLSDGAKVNAIRCPQPALFIAISSNSPILVKHLIHYGANTNDIYEHLFNYSPLGLVISRPFTRDNFEMAKVLLESGADADYRFDYIQETKDQIATDVIIPGPTLLHVVLGKRSENEYEEDIRRQLLKLLLEYNSNAAAQFKGRSSIDVAMGKNVDIFNIFIKGPKTDLNAILNDANQSVLVKMFSINFFKSMLSAERLHTITNLLLCGADPFIKCQDSNNTYENIFVFAKQVLTEMENSNAKTIISPKGPVSKQDSKGKKPDKMKKEDKLSTKSTGKMSVDEVEDYKQAVDLMTDCARLIYVRWLQAKLIKEIVAIINRFRHRHWNMIVKELNGNKNCLWLTPQRCFEIWDILSTTKNKIYKDKRILRHLLCIVIFMSWRNYGHGKESCQTLTASIKDAIDCDVTRLMRKRSQRDRTLPNHDIDTPKLLYVKPELDEDGGKYNVCFECMQPLPQNMISCSWCKLVSFCSNVCIKNNISEGNSHPCNHYLKIMYFSNDDITSNNLTTL